MKQLFSTHYYKYLAISAIFYLVLLLVSINVQAFYYQDQNTLTHNAQQTILDSNVELNVRKSILTLIEKMKQA